MDYDLNNVLNMVFKVNAVKVKTSYEILYDIKFELYEEKDIVYNNDGSFNRVRISENIFVNVCKSDINKAMLSTLNNKIGGCVSHIESGQKIYIGKDLPSEYTYSRSSQSLTIYKKFIKAMIINNLEDLIKYSFNRKYSNDHKPKHIIDAKYGFYRYKIRFSINIKDKEDFYEAIILLRNDADGNKYLYDILGIKELSYI